MSDYDDHDDCDEGPACCKSCGVPLVDHLGVQATCAMLQEALVVIELLLEVGSVVQRDDEIIENNRRRKAARKFFNKVKL